MRTTGVATFIAAMAACIGPDEAIDSAEAQLVLAPGDIYNDPNYVASRLMEMAFLYADRLTDEEIEALYAGEITSQDALDLGAEEHAALDRELRALTDASAVLFDPAAQGPIGTLQNDGRGPPMTTGDMEVRCDDNSYRRCLWFGTTVGGVTTPPPVWPALGLALVYYCTCEHCRGGTVDTICLR
jgi:hypothetical protein